MRPSAVLITAVFIAVSALPFAGEASAQLAATAKKKTAAKSPGKRKVASKTGKAGASKSGTNKSKKAPVVARRSVQQQPTAERYKEIQQALAAKGYFRGAMDGSWGADSTDALKRFQKDQNLDDDGKIGSLSLIALGLGPNRNAASTPAPSAADPTP